MGTPDYDGTGSWPSWPDPVDTSNADTDNSNDNDPNDIIADPTNNGKRNESHTDSWPWWVIIIVVVLVIVVLILLIWWWMSGGSPPPTVLDSLLDPKNSIEPK